MGIRHHWLDKNMQKRSIKLFPNSSGLWVNQWVYRIKSSQSFVTKKIAFYHLASTDFFSALVTMVTSEHDASTANNH
jgi:hypothetical protein